MSQYKAPAECTPSPVLSGATDDPQRHRPAPPQGTEQSQGTSGDEKDALERSGDSPDISQELGEIQHLLRQLHSTLQSTSQSETATPYQQASFGVLTNIADDIAECLDCLRTMGGRSEGGTRPAQPALHSGVPNDVPPVLRRDNGIAGGQPIVFATSGDSPHGGSRGVAPPPPTFHASRPYETRTAAAQLPYGPRRRRHVYHPRTHTQSHIPFPPSPALYQNQWVQSPPVSPLPSASFRHHHHHHHPFGNPDPRWFRSPATSPNSAAVSLPPPPPPPNPTPNDTRQGTPLHGEQDQQQRQPLFPSPGDAGITMSFPLCYDTPAGTRMTLYHSHLPDHPSDFSPYASAFGGLAERQAPGVSSAMAGVSELATETPTPPRVSMSSEENRSSLHPSGRLARVDSDSEDSLDSSEAEMRWTDALEVVSPR
ncbi:hypothetical protein VM1G_06162 [Cytospora mali]|uniref:Uncharacterized protein n=1 Tax=Cytospora mali TaxID=578113 RepID=A0A194W3V0_CYTMA|nr:hypothetical protein VM1G_06162 [Valsa mali]